MLKILWQSKLGSYCKTAAKWLVASVEVVLLGYVSLNKFVVEEHQHMFNYLHKVDANFAVFYTKFHFLKAGSSRIFHRKGFGQQPRRRGGRWWQGDEKQSQFFLFKCVHSKYVHSCFSALTCYWFVLVLSASFFFCHLSNLCVKCICFILNYISLQTTLDTFTLF